MLDNTWVPYWESALDPLLQSGSGGKEEGMLLLSSSDVTSQSVTLTSTQLVHLPIAACIPHEFL